MEAIYWVLTWACHRRCPHCYDDRFRPYVRDELKRVVGEGQAAYRKIIANLPDDMSYLDAMSTRKRSLLVMAGGELLLDGVREELFYPALDEVHARWGDRGPHISVQTTGDILKPDHIEGMLSRGVRTIAIASIDDFHVGLEGDKKFALMDKVRAMMAPFGAREVGLGGARDPRVKAPAPRPADDDRGPFFLFFGAQPDLWIGELWPRGRAWLNGLSEATYETNFCARWSGGKNFLNYGHAGSEVAIEPDGSIYPCCLKTKAPLGSVAEERLVDILDSLKGHPAFEAINQGDPEAMGLSVGWSRDDYRAAAAVTDPKGRQFANVCIGCDAFFAARLGDDLAAIRAARMAKLAATA
jgi:hypothetical protein